MTHATQGWAVLLEVQAAGGGVYSWTRIPDASAQAYALVLEADPTSGRSKIARRGGIIGAIAAAVLLGSALAAVTPDSAAPDGLTLTGRDLWCPILFCFAPLGALVGYGVGRMWNQPPVESFHATFSLRNVNLDGADVGSLVRIESDVPTRSVSIVAERAETRITLENPQDAVTLADVLTDTLLRRANADVQDQHGGG